MTTINQWLRAVTDTVLPRLCSVCGEALAVDERWLCRHCMSQLPRTHYHEVDFNPVEQLFAGKVPVERATGYFFYEKGSPYAQILKNIKYGHMPRMATYLAAQAAREMTASGFFDSVVAIVPVPLHSTKLAQRGYNQSEFIAQGLSQATGLPVVKALKAVHAHDTQTRKGALERYQNTQGVYAVTRRSAALTGGATLIVDDVVTTGSTLASCAQQLRQSLGEVPVSIFTLAVARMSQ